MTMGKQKVVDKSIHPLTTITSITPAGVIPDITQAGVIPVGNYKGVPAFWDLDKANNQPLVNAELAHILGILDGREEGYDLRTLTTVVGVTSPIGTILSGTLVVPAGEVWYINAVETNVNAVGAANGLVGNWRCSLWTDRAAAPNAGGQSFHPVAGLPAAAGALTTTIDEFGAIAPLLVLTNKIPLLRIPAGGILTFTLVTVTAQVDVAVASTIQLFGSVGKVLVA